MIHDKHIDSINQGAADFFYKDSKYFSVCGLHKLCHENSISTLQRESARGQYVNECVPIKLYLENLDAGQT